jgi:hypothetical protein
MGVKVCHVELGTMPWALDITVLMRIFMPKREEVTGIWRRLHNEDLYNFFSLLNIIRVTKLRRVRWAGHVARMGERRGAYSFSVGKPEGTWPLGRPKRRWEDNIKMDLQDVRWGHGLN